MNTFITNQEVESNIKKKFFPVPNIKSQTITIKQTNEVENISNRQEEREFKSNIQKFHYLENSESLQQIFSLCDTGDVLKKWNVYLCGYHKIETSNLAYVEYLMFLDNDKWNFPNITFSCITSANNQNEDEKTQTDVYFENTCQMHMLEYLNLEENQKSMDGFYKGFIESDTLKDTLFVFFDCTTATKKPNNSVKTKWVLIDEIVNCHECLGFSIYDHCYSVFYQDVRLIKIENEYFEKQPVPSILYLCEFKNGQFVNSYSDHEDEDPEKESYVNLLNMRCNYPVLGDFYYFSLRPLEFQSSITKIRRFVGKLHDPIYMIKSLSKIEKVNKQYFALSDVIPSVVDYLSTKQEPEIKIKKSEEEKEGGEAEEKEEEEAEEKEGEEAEETEEKEEYSKEEELFLEALETESSCIYFKEIQEAKEIPFWCLKNNLDFIEL